MASAYAVFANGGYRLPPVIIERITDSKGQVLFEAPKAQLSEEQRAISERNAFVTASLMQEVTRSRARPHAPRARCAARTCTARPAPPTMRSMPGSPASSRALAAVVWIGYDQPRSLGDRESGGGWRCPSGSTS